MHFKLSIPEPCQEDWSRMTPGEQGRFCASCKKEVIDFTALTRNEIASKVQSGTSICGRYRKDQLETNYYIPEKSGLKNLGITAAFTSLLALCNPAQAQNSSTKTQHLIQKDIPDSIHLKAENDLVFTGTVLAQDELPLPGASLMLEGTGIGTQTDFDGNFTLKIPLELFEKSNRLLCKFVGFEDYSIELDKNNLVENIQLKMSEALMGEVVIVRSLNYRTQKPRSRWSRFH